MRGLVNLRRRQGRLWPTEKFWHHAAEPGAFGAVAGEAWLQGRSPDLGVNPLLDPGSISHDVEVELVDEISFASPSPITLGASAAPAFLPGPLNQRWRVWRPVTRRQVESIPWRRGLHVVLRLSAAAASTFSATVPRLR